MDPRPLNRATLARICQNDPEAIRLMERLFIVSGQVTPESIDALTVVVTGQGAQISALDGRVTVAEADINAAQADIATLQSDVSQAQTDITALQADMTAAQDDITGILTRINREPGYAQFYDTTTQTAAAANTAYAITLNTTDIARHVSVVSGSRVTVTQAAIYNFQVSIQLDKTSGGVGLFWLWFAKNGTDIANSASQVRVQGNDDEIFVALNLFVDMAAGDYVELKWAVDDTSVQIEAFPASAPVPAIPSVILTVSDNLEGVKP